MTSPIASPSADNSVNSPKAGPFLALSVGLLSISFAPIFIRLAETELGANATVLNRMVVFLVVFGLGRWISQQVSSLVAPDTAIATSDTSPETEKFAESQAFQYLLLVGAGVVSVTSLILWAVSLQHTTVAKCMLLNNLTPIFTSLGSWLLFRKNFDKRFLLGMAIALAGAIALSFEDLHSANGLLIGDLYALLSAVFLGSYFLLVEKLRQQFSATTILLWRCAVGSALLFPLTLATEHQLVPTEMIPLLAVLGLGIVSEGMGQRLLADSMQHFSSSFVALFLLLEPIISAILAWVIFAEALTSSTWLGFAVVLGGIYLAQSSQSSGQSAVNDDDGVAGNTDNNVAGDAIASSSKDSNNTDPNHMASNNVIQDEAKPVAEIEETTPFSITLSPAQPESSAKKSSVH